QVIPQPNNSTEAQFDFAVLGGGAPRMERWRCAHRDCLDMIAIPARTTWEIATFSYPNHDHAKGDQSAVAWVGS
ncbi:MAG TPA: hypothetical protein VF163_19355, partial [Micromonosporaceae bacterium]